MRSLILLLLLSMSCWAQIGMRGPAFMAGLPHPGAPVPPNYSFREGFEGTGYDNSNANGWVEHGPGTMDEDCATNAMGTQAFQIDGVASGTLTYISAALPAANSNNLFFAFRLPIAPGGTQQRFTLSHTGADDAILEITAGSAIKAWQGSVNTTGGTTLLQNTWYYVWLVHFKSSGANDGVCNIYLSTTPTRPPGIEASVTTGNSTTQPDMITIQAVQTDRWIIDYIRVSPNIINSSPE